MNGCFKAPYRHDTGEIEAEILVLASANSGEQDEFVVLDIVEHDGRKLLVIQSVEQFQAFVDADEGGEEPLEMELMVAEEVDGQVVEILDPDMISFVEQIMCASEGNPEVMEVAADHVEAHREAVEADR